MKPIFTRLGRVPGYSDPWQKSPTITIKLHWYYNKRYILGSTFILLGEQRQSEYFAVTAWAISHRRVFFLNLHLPTLLSINH